MSRMTVEWSCSMRGTWRRSSFLTHSRPFPAKTKSAPQNLSVFWNAPEIGYTTSSMSLPVLL